MSSSASGRAEGDAPEVAASGSVRAGLVGLVGCPNAGKSTLLNQLVGEKLAIATPRPQTTRNRILAVKNRAARGDLPPAQLVLVDTPGLHRPSGRGRSRLNQFMVREALSVLGEVDVVVAMLEVGPVPKAKPAKEGKAGKRKTAAPAFRVDPAFGYVLEEVVRAGRKAVLALNKVDLLRDKRQLLPLLEGYAKAHDWAAIVPISAAQGTGIDLLEDEIIRALPPGEPLFPAEMLTDRAERFLVAELVREQLFLLTKQEIPYATCVTIEDWEERAGTDGERGGVHIHATIHVEKEAQKRIVVGEGGRMVREIGTRARFEIEKLLGCPIFLKLFVRVDSGWTENTRLLRELGYE